MSIPLFHVDAFTGRPFGGNPAAVCLLDRPREDRWLQSVAAEMNLSETAFVRREGEVFELRWFTPQIEVALCGHATLATAHVLWQEGLVPRAESIAFQTKSGILKAALRGEQIELDFPLEPEHEASAPDGLAEALGVEPLYVGKNRMDYLVELASDAAVRAVKPNFAQLASIDSRGFIVTARSSDARFDFVSRFFGPAAGIPEDPVTGSAHCCLADFWRKRLGKSQFVAYQASSRGGIVGVRIEGSRVALAGTAVTITAGKLLID